MRVGDRPAAAGKHRLDDVPLRHRAIAAAGEERANVCEGCFVLDEVDANRRGNCLPRQIVGGRAEAAGRDYDLRPTDRGAEHGHVGLQIVADRGVKHHVDTQFGEPLGEPLAVGVEPLAGRKFVANRNDLRTHVESWGKMGRNCVKSAWYPILAARMPFAQGPNFRLKWT